MVVSRNKSYPVTSIDFIHNCILKPCFDWNDNIKMSGFESCLNLLFIFHCLCLSFCIYGHCSLVVLTYDNYTPLVLG